MYQDLKLHGKILQPLLFIMNFVYICGTSFLWPLVTPSSFGVLTLIYCLLFFHLLKKARAVRNNLFQ